MNVETEICKALKALFETRLPAVQVIGNWVAESETVKGLETTVEPTVYVDVSPRRYDSYTGPVAEFRVELSGEASMSDDVSLDETREAYDSVTSLLEEWRRDIAAVKRDLTVGGFDPVGLRLDGGTLEIDRETKSRHFTQQFTLKGRIS